MIYISPCTITVDTPYTIRTVKFAGLPLGRYGANVDKINGGVSYEHSLHFMTFPVRCRHYICHYTCSHILMETRIRQGVEKYPA